MFWKEKITVIKPAIQMKALIEIFKELLPVSPLSFTEFRGVNVQDFTIRRVSKFRVREKSIDIDFCRKSKENAEMEAVVKMRFIGRLDIPYEVTIRMSIVYENKFTFDYYVKNAAWTYIYSLLVTTNELTRLYPDGMVIPTELYVDDKIQPVLKLITKNI